MGDVSIRQAKKTCSEPARNLPTPPPPHLARDPKHSAVGGKQDTLIAKKASHTSAANPKLLRRHLHEAIAVLYLSKPLSRRGPSSHAHDEPRNLGGDELKSEEPLMTKDGKLLRKGSKRHVVLLCVGYVLISLIYTFNM